MLSWTTREPVFQRPRSKYSIISCMFMEKLISCHPENFVNICTIRANISNPLIVSKLAPAGKHYYALSFDVILKFGLTELTAHVEWKDKNVMHLLH